MNEVENELETLRKTLQIKDYDYWDQETPYDFKIASVIAYRGGFTDRILILDKGRNHNIKEDYPVISEDGIVGKVLTVFPNHALVLPITNSMFKLGVITEKNSVQGLLEADDYGNMYMNLISAGAQISPGDLVVTSVVSRIFPRGFPVGRVSKLVKNPEDVYMKAMITPYAEINNLEQVSVLFYHKELPDE
jgi:rod shape-determining protein MreC